MKEKFIRKIQKTSTHSYVINIPKDLVSRFSWREKQKLEIVFSGRRGQILVRNWKKKRKKRR